MIYRRTEGYEDYYLWDTERGICFVFEYSNASNIWYVAKCTSVVNLIKKKDIKYLADVQDDAELERTCSNWHNAISKRKTFPTHDSI